MLVFAYIKHSLPQETRTIMNRHLPIALLAIWPGLALADGLPGLPPAGQQAYRDFQQAPDHRAFAIAPGGAWAWQAAADSGERLADLAFRNAQGKPSSIDKLAGKVVVVHLWGSWCSPCRKEMPELAKLHTRLADRKDIAFVVLQMREPYATASLWLKQQRLALPLADSGSRNESDELLRLGDGGRIADRELARSFPSTYVLDKRGLIIFAQAGPVHDWPQYEAFLRHAATHSGK